MSDLPDFSTELANIDKWEPEVRALVDWSGAPIQQVPPPPGPLAGWSLAVKDIIDVEGQPTGLGAPFVPTSPAPADAAVVAALRRTGMSVLAKAVTTTFAFYDPGPTRNPWNTAHTPGGSSSGSAAAVACGMARIALGSQTVGSVNRPASFCGVVGFKPSYGAVPIDGVFPFAPSVDTVGWFARSASDARAVWSALASARAGEDGDGRARDEVDTSHGEPAADGHRALRIALVLDLGCAPADPAMIEATSYAAARLAGGGHRVATVDLPKDVIAAYEHHTRLVAAEAAESHARLFAEHGDEYPRHMRDLIAMGRSVSLGEREAIEVHRARTSSALARTLLEFDAILTPSAPGEAPSGLGSTGDPRMSLLWTYTGLPTVTLPVSLGPTGLPLGIQLVGRAGHDSRLLDVALSVEGTLGGLGSPPHPGKKPHR